MSTLSFSIKTAAEATSLSPQSIERAIKSGALKARKSSRNEKGEPTGKYLILARDLERYLDGLVEA